GRRDPDPDSPQRGAPRDLSHGAETLTRPIGMRADLRTARRYRDVCWRCIEMRRSLYFCGLLAITACRGADVRQGAPAPKAQIELVESTPIETSMDHPDLRDADIVWREMNDRAKSTIDFAEFYASDEK